ncbi:Lipoprotein-releasing system transmembrane protein LolE [termite gut metagenome]|uniref:Lipoprotein-releasing system transmembrane protein LolE n=1 Tax=termite gut metagenome TaxID=433724 RepID=A0A5J4SRL0_9ZZZZ
MNLSLFIAKRYLFSKKKHNAVNIISAVSLCGVTLATLTLVCTLSVFNGFQDTVTGFFTAFDPELKITAREGKVFDAQTDCIRQIHSLPEIAILTETLEENAMVQYKDRQVMAIIKGVEDNFEQLTAIDNILYGSGNFILHDSIVNYGIPGIEIFSKLGTSIQFTGFFSVYVPKRNAPINLNNPVSSFNKKYLYPSGVAFIVNQQAYDGQYILTSLDFARQLLEYTTEVSAIELKLIPEANISSVKAKIESLIGNDYFVKTRYEQQADIFRIMKIEKLISYLFLTFILMIACFNVIGSLSMLILDKKDDVNTLRNLGANNRLISLIFLFEGWMISFLGALAGIMLGLTLCFIQQKSGIVTMGTNGGFVINSYPVSVHANDVGIIFVTVLVIGFLSVWYPVRYLSKRLLKNS